MFYFSSYSFHFAPLISSSPLLHCSTSVSAVDYYIFSFVVGSTAFRFFSYFFPKGLEHLQPYIFTTLNKKPLRFETEILLWQNIYSLKYHILFSSSFEAFINYYITVTSPQKNKIEVVMNP